MTERTATRLTDSMVQSALKRAAASGQRTDIADPALPGLRLRITPSGGRTWVLACRDPLGRMRRFPLGDFASMGISQARNAARAMRVEVRKGADPIAERKRQRAIGKDARDGIGTLRALLDLYSERDGAALKSWPECRRRIDSVFAPFLESPLAVMKVGDLQMQADRWRARGSASAGVRYLRPVLKWAAHRGYAAAELGTLHPPATVRQRDRVLSQAELSAILPVLAASDRPYAAALRFMLLTLARREEVGAATWSDMSLAEAVWTIPQTKSGRTHKVPLSRQAIALIGSLKPDTPDPNALVFSTRTGERLQNWDRESKAIMEASGTAGWTRHDLRRTGATMLGEMGVEPHVIEAALNHAAVHSQLAAIYNRARYFPAVRDALQLLADTLDALAIQR